MYGSRTTGDATDDPGSATTRRRLLAGGGAAAAAGLAGCSTLDVLTGDEPAEFEAGTATVSDAALADSGYELNEVYDEVVSEEFEAAGQTREVQVTNRVAEYDKAVELFGERYQAAVVAVLTTPRVEVLGTSFNPIADMDQDELAGLVENYYDDLRDLDRGSEYTTEILDTDATVAVYEGEAEIEDTSLTVDLRMHVPEPVEAGDDFVLPLGAYPEAFGDGENVRRMFNGVQHTDD